ncbi:MAG TPA: universal stress protein [Bacteroidales bacterium]|nr:universal stress protein [Bacteroidales bacterium]
MKKILIPTDFSDISKNSILYGFQLAKDLGLSVELLHVLEIYKFAAGASEAELISSILPSDNIKMMEESAMTSFENLIQEINPSLPASVPFNKKVIAGHLVNEVISESATEEIELLILAVSRSQDLITRFTHNTISSIISESMCPVMVVPSNASYKPIEKLVFATDFNKADIALLQSFLKLSKNKQPDIQILHVSPKPIDFNAELKMTGFKQKIAESINCKCLSYKQIQAKPVVKGILDALDADNADILLMLKEHEGFFKSLLEIDATEKIAHYIKIPMLSYREQLFNPNKK